MTDPFADPEVGPPRDRWGRPLLIKKGETERTPFTRASSMANYIADHTGLATWERRLLAVGLSQRSDLVAMAAALPAQKSLRADKKALTKAERDADAKTCKSLDEIIEQALEHAGRSFKANMGTAIHSATDPGADISVIPEAIQPDARSFLDELARYGAEIVATEVFVANDHLTAAGSFDHLVSFPGLGVVVLDKKTGMVDGKGLAFSVQLAVYAGGEVYDCETDERAPLESLTGGEAVNQNVGVIAHIPLGQGRTAFHTVDLNVGRHGAGLASRVRAARQVKDVMSPLAAWPVEVAS